MWYNLSCRGQQNNSRAFRFLSAASPQLYIVGEMPSVCMDSRPVLLASTAAVIHGGHFVMAKEIELTQGKYALVDDADYAELSKHKWTLIRGDHHRAPDYAVRSVKIDGKPKAILMHRQIMGFPNCGIDHIDGNGLNNCRENLRTATQQQNNFNRRIYKNNQSGYKGVYMNTGKRKWRAVIRFDKKSIHLGYYFTKEDAAIAYDDAAREYFGEFAKTNF